MTKPDIPDLARSLLGHMQASRLTARERHELWDIAFPQTPITAVQITTVERIAAKLEGRRAA
jgi:hypothetical protein